MTQRRGSQPATLISNRARLLAPAAIATALFARGAFASAAQGSDSPDSLLESAVIAMTELDSFSFHMTTREGETRFFEGIALKEVTGSVQRPNLFRADAKVDLMLATITLTMISADGRLWFTDPFGSRDTWREVPLDEFDEIDPTVVINPDRLLLPALSLIAEPMLSGEEDLDEGARAKRIDGSVDLRAVTGLSGSTAEDEFGFSLPEGVPFSVWIDSDSLVRRIEVSGPILPLEPDSIVRRVDLFGFNEPVDIQPPN